MEQLLLFLASLRPTSLMPVALLLLAGGGLAVAWSMLTERGEKNDVKRRLKVVASALAIQLLTRNAPTAPAKKQPKRMRKNVPTAPGSM